MNKGLLTYKGIFRFWAPLCATWLMMSVEGPYLAAIIARMADPKFNLAAYGVAFSFAMIIESPIIMMMSASTALVRDSDSYRKLQNFCNFLNAAITVAAVVFVIPPVFNFIIKGLIGLPENVSTLIHIGTIILIPWPAAIGYRRFYQGILIRNNQTKKVAYGTAVRLFSMSLTAFILYLSGNVSGIIVGASALSAGVLMEAAASRLMAAGVVRKLKTIQPHGSEKLLSYKEIARFYYPLALTSILTLAVNPLVTFFLGQSRLPIESLAVLPVLNSFIFIFRSFGVSYQETSIALMSEERKANYRPVRNFAALMGLGTIMLLGIIVFFSLSDFWFSALSGLSEDLSRLAHIPLLFMMFLPALEVLISFQRSILVISRTTRPVTAATAIEVSGIIIGLLICVNYMNLIGVTAAAIALIAGRVFANLYLFLPFFRVVRKEGFVS